MRVCSALLQLEASSDAAHDTLTTVLMNVEMESPAVLTESWPSKTECRILLVIHAMNKHQKSVESVCVPS